MMMPDVWCSARALPGRQEKSGSSESATFMRNVPEPERQFEIRRRNSASSAAGSTSRVKSSFGFRFETTIFRAHRLAASVTTPTARPFSTITSRTAASVRISTPRASQQRAIACVIAPMPPIAWPHTPVLPFTSPKA